LYAWREKKIKKGKKGRCERDEGGYGRGGCNTGAASGFVKYHERGIVF